MDVLCQRARDNMTGGSAKDYWMAVGGVDALLQVLELITGWRAD
jgi:hypothetical protein